MKTILTFLLLILCSFALFAQQNDTIVKSNKSQLLIGIHAGCGSGWRIYKDIPDTLLMNKLFPGTERPGLAYYYSISVGLINNRNSISLGLEFCNSTYSNNFNNEYFVKYTNVADSLFISNYKYKFVHKLMSIPIYYHYSMGKKRNWNISTSIRVGWLIDYYKTVENSLSSKHDVDLTKNYFVAAASLGLGRTLIETKNMLLSVDLEFLSSTTIGSKVKILGTPNESVYYQSKPHYLLIPFIRFNFNYKL